MWRKTLLSSFQLIPFDIRLGTGAFRFKIFVEIKSIIKIQTFPF